VERNAVDARAPNDERRVFADGEVVWSWRQEHFLNYFKGKFSLKSAGPD
jgi:hypothetical protein